MSTIEQYHQAKIEELRRSNGNISTSGELLEQYRKKAGFSQQSFAEIIGVDDSTIARIEANARKLPRVISFYERLITIPGLSEDEIATLLHTERAPRWLMPDDKKTAQDAGLEFGRLLRFYRERLSISQRKLAKETYSEESTIAKVETGTRVPPREPLFYDRLPSALSLSDQEYAQLLLTSHPPRWLVPELYTALEEDQQGGKIARRVVASVENRVLETTFYVEPGKYTNDELKAYEQVIEGLSKIYLRGKLRNAKEILQLLGLDKVTIRPYQKKD